jgi:uncharacterized protein (DUF1501 family)
MAITRRDFIRGGVAAFTVSFTAPTFLADIARAQGARSRSLVVLYLSGGNDALNTVVPYLDPFYYSRRPTIAVPAVQVLQIGTDNSGRALGLHPRLTGLRDIYNEGLLAIVQRTGYLNSSRSHFQGLDIWGTADPSSATSMGWLGRYLETVPADPLSGWATTREVPRALVSKTVGVPAIPDARTYSFNSPNSLTEAVYERAAATRISSHVPIDKPQLAFVNGSALGALETLDRVASVASYNGTVPYPNNGLAIALRTVAGSIVRGTGTRVYWVQTGGFDTHAGQGNVGGGAYATLMSTVSDSVRAFYNDLRNQGLLGDTLVLQFSEFGRRGVMLAIGGGVRGGIYGTAPSLDPNSPTLENNGGDVRYETDFRSVYAKVLDSWLGASSTSILGADFRAGAPAIV